ncbi:hypothetical protein [Pedobacter nototheniae]|uniref:hypothetical protein n=1 Tax=Pedobacter nototheniae TaxID=2488994 RepID=UPI0029318745|nr:hypothetical protein [Pedobacter nototheniae]
MNKFIFAIVFIASSFFSPKTFSQSYGEGCKVENVVYTNYLGEARPYGSSNPLTKFYQKPGPNIQIWYNNSNTGYKCGYINSYGSSSYWDGTKNVSIPAQNEILATKGDCVTAATLGGSITGNGVLVDYKVNDPTYCSSPPTNNLPIDDYMPGVILLAGGIGVFFIKKQILA